MKFDMVQPCDNCPFRSDKVFHLADGRVRQIADSLLNRQQTFACHKTTEFDDEGETKHSDDEQHCAGALILLEKLERPNQMMRIAERCRFYDRSKLKMDAPVYDSFEEMRRTIKKKTTK